MSDRRDTYLSKTLSWLLRHGAVKESLNIKADGFISVKDLLNHKSLKGKFNSDDIERVVQNNSKHRFSLRLDNELLEICANQGHSIRGLEDLNLVPIREALNIDVIHGTYYKNWNSIKNSGLNRMKRNHIHFATGLPNDKKVISGVRQDSEVFIYIDLKLALDDNLKFYKSVNDVILSPGNESGTILPKYFNKVIDKAGENIL